MDGHWHRQDDELAHQLLTCELPNWSRQNCLRLAFACGHRGLLAHPCSQWILSDLWMGGLRTRRWTNLKVILSILFPPLILRLDFKSKAELQLMPQTEEEHLFEMREENSQILDRSVGRLSYSIEADIQSDPFQKPARNRDGDGKKTSATGGAEAIANNNKRSGKNQQLSTKKKLYEFYAAPVTTFWAHSMAYIAFLLIYTYTILFALPDDPAWNEYYVIAFIATYGCDKMREMLVSEPLQLRQKLSVWSTNWWNILDATFIVEYFLALVLRVNGDTLDQGRALYCLNIVYWYSIHFLKID